LFILANSPIILGVKLPPHLAHLPMPSAEAQAHSDALRAHIANDIAEHGGCISFARYMELALYAPGLGYYTAGARKLGEAGDFITAPELSPLFAQCLARQVAQLATRALLELGAGSGALACGLLLALQDMNALPERYGILEPSADLRERQRARVAQLPSALSARVHWLDALPADIDGVVLANEVLDATPAERVRVTTSGIEQWGVTLDDSDNLRFVARAAPEPLAREVAALKLAPGYDTDINLTARALVGSLARMLTRGTLLLIDYGFPAREFYHPQRNRGTLMCHYRHRAHDDPFVLPGLQDITTHVDFSAVAAAAHAAGAQVLGYTNQAQFLINCGITDLLAQTPARDVARYVPLTAAAQKLLSPAEMGELFKVIALGKGIDTPLLGFAHGDKSHTL
jgi:SAM-dependent MidA family methyltransferase